MTTKRQQIANKIKEYLENIKISNGYNTDLGNNVLYYHATQKEKIEHLIFQDGDEKYEDTNNRRESELSIDIQAVRYGFEYGILINETVEDILKAIIKKNDRSLGLKNVYVEPIDSTSDIDLNGRDFVIIQVRFKVTYLIDIE